MIIFPELSDGMVEQVQIADEITVTLRATSPTAPCPATGTVAKREANPKRGKTERLLERGTCWFIPRANKRHFY
jgi:hypothetical protein